MKLTQLNLNQDSGKELAPERTTLRQFFGSLSLAQFWGLITILCAILSTAFIIGYRLSTNYWSVLEARQRSKIEELENELKEQRKKNRVAAKQKDLKIYDERYKLAKRNAERSPDEVTLEELEQSKQDFGAFLDREVGSNIDENGEADLQVDKNPESRCNSGIKLRDNTETFFVPREVKDVTKHVLWHSKRGSDLSPAAGVISIGLRKPVNSQAPASNGREVFSQPAKLRIQRPLTTRPTEYRSLSF